MAPVVPEPLPFYRTKPGRTVEVHVQPSGTSSLDDSDATQTIGAAHTRLLRSVALIECIQKARMKVVRLILIVLLPGVCPAQVEPPPRPEAPPAAQWTYWQGGASQARIRARLRDESAFARQHRVEVEVEVRHVFLALNPTDRSGYQRGLLRYQLDSGPPILTTQTRQRFEHLSAGHHTITVAVVGADAHPLTPKVELRVEIPH